MKVFWVNVFRRWDGTIVYSQTANGTLDRGAAETALLYQGRCTLIYRFSVASGCESAPGCTRVTDTAFVDLNGRCRGCSAAPLSACLCAFRGPASATTSLNRASGD